MSKPPEAGPKPKANKRAVPKSGADSDTEATLDSETPRLRMYLDEDRDGDADPIPAQVADWQWGEPKDGEALGAIIMVKALVYADDEDVAERAPMEFRWSHGPPPAKFEARLEAEPKERIRVYLGPRENATLLLGGPDGPASCDLHSLESGQWDRAKPLQLWMEASQYPDKGEEDQWRVTLRHKFALNGDEKVSDAAQVRIAPWIMASDLDPTLKVFAKVGTRGDNALPDAIREWVGEGSFEAATVPDARDKGFARDPIKSGYTIVPGYSGVVVQVDLDALLSKINQALSGMPEDRAKSPVTTHLAGVIRQPPDVDESDQVPQDQGGNLLVGPPGDKYPYGRIIYGGRPRAADFYHAQRHQTPVAMDSSWLRVGHVDEMLSFARGSNGKYYAFLMSPRLAYIILHPLAGGGPMTHQGGPATDALLAWAKEKSSKCIGLEGDKLQKALEHELRHFPVPEESASALVYGADVIAPVEGFHDNPPPPAHGVGGKAASIPLFVVLRVGKSDTEVAMQCLGEDQKTVAAAMPGEHDVYEIRVHPRHLLKNYGGELLEALKFAQPHLDRARQVLKSELGFTDETIIEVPVLLRRHEGAGCVGLTADSVNMLVLGEGEGTRCLVPKPFGPVSRSVYVFEHYLTGAFKDIGVDHTFLADDAFHIHDGEIHCGTNQLPRALERRPGDAKQKRAEWWVGEPPPATEPPPPERVMVEKETPVVLMGGEQLPYGLKVETTSITLKGYVDSLPGQVNHGVGKLEPGDSVTVASLALPEGAKEIVTPADTVLAVVNMPPPEPEPGPVDVGIPPPPPPPPPPKRPRDGATAPDDGG